jgi:hypothetical protein
MSEQVVEERRGWASDIVWVVLYSILVHGRLQPFAAQKHRSSFAKA